ncbi:hypothetical protein J6590_044139, partial [Homalodisca vitripennis]
NFKRPKLTSVGSFWNPRETGLIQRSRTLIEREFSKIGSYHITSSTSSPDAEISRSYLDTNDPTAPRWKYPITQNFPTIELKMFSTNFPKRSSRCYCRGYKMSPQQVYVCTFRKPIVFNEQ